MPSQLIFWVLVPLIGQYFFLNIGLKVYFGVWDENIIDAIEKNVRLLVLILYWGITKTGWTGFIFSFLGPNQMQSNLF